MVTINENINFTDYAPGIRLPDCSKLAINWKNDNDVTIFQHDIIIKFFWRCFFFSLIKFSYCSKFHVNIITGSGVMTIFFYKGLTRNPEIGNTPAWVLPNIWRLGQVGDTEFGTIVSNKILLNATKFWVIKGKPIGGGGINLPPTPPQIRIKKLAKLIWAINFALQKLQALNFLLSVGHNIYLWVLLGKFCQCGIISRLQCYTL